MEQQLGLALPQLQDYSLKSVGEGKKRNVLNKLSRESVWVRTKDCASAYGENRVIC